MLQVPYIREHKQYVIDALKKRHLDATEMIEQVLQLDEDRRKTQTNLDRRTRKEKAKQELKTNNRNAHGMRH